MGAAAVFETAAETPPTVEKLLALCPLLSDASKLLSPALRSFGHLEKRGDSIADDGREVERTQEVDDEAGHAHAR